MAKFKCVTNRDMGPIVSSIINQSINDIYGLSKIDLPSIVKSTFRD